MYFHPCLGLQFSPRRGGNAPRTGLRTWMCPLPWRISSISSGLSRSSRICECLPVSQLSPPFQSHLHSRVHNGAGEQRISPPPHLGLVEPPAGLSGGPHSTISSDPHSGSQRWQAACPRSVAVRTQLEVLASHSTRSVTPVLRNPPSDAASLPFCSGGNSGRRRCSLTNSTGRGFSTAA